MTSSLGSTQSLSLAAAVSNLDLPLLSPLELLPWSIAANLSSSVFATLLPTWFNIDQLSTMIFFYRRPLNLPHMPIPTPSSTSAFFIPFYSGLTISNTSGPPTPPPTTVTASTPHSSARSLTKHSFLRSDGNDHFIVLGSTTWDIGRSSDADWGGCFIYILGMGNVTCLLIKCNPWDELDAGIIYSTRFHPHSAADVLSWQRFILFRRWPTIFDFAGAARVRMKNDLRGLLLRECTSARAVCRAVDCGHGR